MGIGVLLIPTFVAAQTNGSQGGTASNIPVLAGGQMPGVTPGEEEAPPNVFQGSLIVGSYYDDNAVPGVVPREWDVDYSIRPEFSLQETRQRIVWGLTYSPGIEISQRLLSRNEFVQKFEGHMTWETSPHGTLSAQQYYLVTTNPFAGFTTTSPGPIISPNETIYVPNARQKLSLSNVLYSYQSSARTTMGVGGAFQLHDLDSTPESGPTTALIYAQVASGEAYISHQLTARNQLGFQYGLQVLKFPEENARTTTHTFLVFDQMNLSSHAGLTLYGGPEYSLTSNQVALNLGFVIITIPVKANQWSASGGVIYNWTGDRFAAAIDFSRRISDGGGLIGAVELTAGSALLTWQMTRNWSLTSSISGADDQLLGQNTGSNELRSYTGKMGVRRQLGRDFGMGFYYQRFNQTGSIDGLSIGNRDIIGVKLDYSFMKPLGG